MQSGDSDEDFSKDYILHFVTQRRRMVMYNLWWIMHHTFHAYSSRKSSHEFLPAYPNNLLD